MGILDFLFSSSTRSAGRDFIKHVNKTHVEYGTRHVVATTGGFRLFDVNAEGAGGVSNGSGFTGLGWMSDILLMLAAIAVTAWAYHRYAKKKVRHESYKSFFRAQSGYPSDQYGPVPAVRYERRRSERARQDEETVKIAAVHGARRKVEKTTPRDKNFRVEV